MEYSRRFQYHYAPKKGWVNDPNGLVYFQGYYHVFYQHAPHFEAPWKEPICWGHARTKDFLNWEELPVALTPEFPYEKDGCWSGTAIVKDDVLYLFYTSVILREGETHYDQNVSMAFSTDGVHFTKCESNPIISTYPADGSPDFRDPAVCEIDGHYYIAMASGNPEARAARVLLYQSEDLVHWDYKGILCEWENAQFTECPSFMKAGDRALLTASVDFFGPRHFSVMYGDFADGKFTVQCSAEVDKGPDQYAGQVFLDDKGRNLLITWIPGWRYIDYLDFDIGCMSVPRQLKCENGRITAYPVEELQHLLTDEDDAVKRTADGFVIERHGRDPVVYQGEIRDLKILRDGCVVEVFVNGGEEVFAALL